MKGVPKRRTGPRGTVWTVQIDIGPDPVTGKRRRRRLTAPTRKQLEEEQATIIHQLTTGTAVDQHQMTVGAYLTYWLTTIEPTIRPTSVARYAGVITQHVTPALGAVKLAKLAPAHLQRYVADKRATGLAPATVALHYTIIHHALRQAVRWQLLPRNVAEAVDPPRPAPPQPTVWTPDQVRAFLAATHDHPLHAAFRLAVLTGMRRGELLALRWQDIDLAGGTARIVRTQTRDRENRWTIGEPKSRSGRRSVALPASTVVALRHYQAHQAQRQRAAGALWSDEGIIFDRGDGRMLHPNALYRALQQATRAHGLPRLRFHDLRHTSATVMLALGEHPKVVSERLGHSSVSLTLDRYSHVSMDLQRAAADRLDHALQPADPGQCHQTVTSGG